MAFTQEELIGLAQSEYATIVSARKAKVEGWFLRMDGEAKSTFEQVLEEALEGEARRIVRFAIDHMNPHASFGVDVVQLAIDSWTACNDQVKEEYDAIDVFYGFSSILNEWGYEAPSKGKVMLEIELGQVSEEPIEEVPPAVDENAA